MKTYLLLVLMLWTGSIWAQRVIKGKVSDSESGEALIGAHLYFLNHFRIGAVTDEQGSYSLQVPALAEEDSLVVSYLGYQERVVPIKDQLNLLLIPQEAVWEEVVVTAEPLIAEEFKYLEIKKLEIYTNPAAKADPLLAVNSLPAATTTDESANISLRGSSPLETGIFLNNVPVYDAVRYSQLNGIGTFSLFSTSIIKEVTVFPGNPPLEYGNATSGIIALTTDERVVEENSNSAIVSLANVGYSREQRISQRQSLKLFANYQPSGVLKALNEKSLDDIKSFESGDLGVYWFGASKQFQWKLFNYNLLEGYKFNFQHPSFQGIFDQKKRRTFTTLSMERKANIGTWSLNLGSSFSRGTFGYSNVEFDVDKNDFFSGLNYAFSGAKYQVKSGISYDHRMADLRGNFHRFSHALGTNHPTDPIQERSRSQSLESFLYFKYFITNELAVGTGLRKNIPIKGQDNYLSGQINLSYHQGPWGLILGAGRYNKHSLPENSGGLLQVASDQVALDLKYTTANWSATASTFIKESTINEASYNLIGVELYSKLKISNNFSGSLSFTWLDAQTVDDTPYPYDLSYFIKGNVTYNPAANWTIEGVFTARDGVLHLPVEAAIFDTQLQVYEPISAGATNRLPSYASLGVSVSKLFAVSDRLGMIAFASINNLMDAKNVRNYGYSFDYQMQNPNFFSRRTGYVGMVLNF